jgi:hypothetical protein
LPEGPGEGVVDPIANYGDKTDKSVAGVKEVEADEVEERDAEGHARSAVQKWQAGGVTAGVGVSKGFAR